MTDLCSEFIQHASPESIRTQIQRARANRDRWQRRVDRLARLLDERLGQIDAGTWPSPVNDEAERTSP